MKIRIGRIAYEIKRVKTEDDILHREVKECIKRLEALILDYGLSSSAGWRRDRIVKALRNL